VAEQSETAKSHRRWTIIVTLVILAIIVFGIYSCTKAGVKESPNKAMLLPALAGLV
jgi:hypothetical protein